jgi:hypothetical protein
MNSTPSPGRLAAIITGGVVASLATLVLAGGAAFHWLEGEKDADGYYQSSSERLTTGTYALATENLDIDDGLPGGENRWGKVRFKVRAGDEAPVFVGVARSADVADYLGTSSRATLTDVEVDPFEADYRESGLNVKPAAPASQSIWAAATEGSGTQTLTWDVEDGDWSVVVMNADGSAGVDADVSVGANVPIVDDLATGFTIAGFSLLGLGLALMAGGLIRPRRQPSWPAGSASAA